jgi:hypothetical protein
MTLCPYETGKDVLACRAGKEIYIPNPQDREHYCICPEFKNCPLYCRAEYGTRQKAIVLG